jgi:hypothetical protein
MIEKKVLYHLIDLGFERVTIPIRVTFEYEVKNGTYVPDSLSCQTLFNQQAIAKRYPNMAPESLKKSIDRQIKDRLKRYLLGPANINSRLANKSLP